jgi:8-oxo-dGTP diphosphatase
LIQRGNEPFKGLWALPGGFIEIDEELDNAITRELAEETGLREVKLEQIHTFGTVGRDPRGRQISVVYMGIITGKQKRVRGGDDASKAQWFELEKVPEKLAFDHKEIISFAAKKLKEKTPNLDK